MKMKNLFKFFCMMVAVLLGQSVWAQSSVANNFRWSTGDLNSIVKPKGATWAQFEKTTDDGFMTVNISCTSHDVEYEERTDWSLMSSKFLHVGHVAASQIVAGAYAWKPKGTGYQVLVQSLETETAIPGSYCYYTLGSQDEKRVDLSYSLGWKTTTETVAEGQETVAYQFRGGSNRQNADKGYGAATNAFSMKYQVKPDAPKFVGSDVVVTVDTNNIHWYVLADQFEVNPAFQGTLNVTAEIKGKGHLDKYIVWNADNSAFYAIKPVKVTLTASIAAYNGKYDSYDDERSGAYLASETTTESVSSKIPSDEIPQIFFIVDDVWVRDVNEAGQNFVSYLVTVPQEHFVEYVCMAEGQVEYVEKGETAVTYLDSVRVRHDYFYMKQTTGGDNLTVKIAKSGPATLRINAIGVEPNRVPFLINSQAKYNDLYSASYETSWVDSYKAQEDQVFTNCAKFSWEYAIYSSRVRKYDIHFIGVPDSLFFEYGNSADRGENAEFRVYKSDDGVTWVQLGETITGRHFPQPKSASDGSPVFGAYKLDYTTQYLRFTYTGVQFAAYVKDIKVTEKKMIDILPQDTLIDFGTFKRTVGKTETRKDSLAWVNVFPELRYTVDEPFSAKGRIRVRLDEWDTVRSHNKFIAQLDLDTVGIFTKRLKIASMDVKVPTDAYVTLKAQTNFDTEDMFAKVNGKDNDTIYYDSLAVFTIQDSLGYILSHDSLIVSYVYNEDSMQIVNDSLVSACVGMHKIIVNAQKNTLVPQEWSDTLYLYVRENNMDTITFSVPAEIGMKDTLPADFVTALDTTAVLTYEFDKPGYFEVKEGRLIALVNDKADSVWVKVSASQTCEHFANTDSVRVLVRGIVHPEFNPSIPWMTDVFGNDTLVDPLQVWNYEETATLNNEENINIAFEYDPNDVVVDSVANQWYLRRSTEDSLMVKVTVSGDTIKTVKDSIKFPVREYIARVVWPGTVNDRGYYYIGDTLKVEDFRAYATNPERLDKDLTDLVIWTKEFVEAADGTVLEDGSVRLDSINSIVLGVCLDTLFVKDTCAYDTLRVYPAKVGAWRFPGTNPDSIMVVGDSILVQDIFVLDTAGRNLDMYVRYDFNYVPSDFAHHSNEKGLSTQFDYVVLDKNGLDTTAVDTIISNIRGGLVEDTTFRDRLLIAPVYAVDAKLPKYDFIVGDTLYVKDVVAIDAKGNDVTRYSNFMFAFADSVAHRVEGGIILDKAGKDIQIKIVAKRNESMHQGMIYASINVQPIEIKAIEGIDDEYFVFDVLDTKTLIFRDSLGRDMTQYVDASYVIDEALASQKDDKINFNHAGDMTINVKIAGNATGDLNKDITIKAYDKAVVKFNSKSYIVGDDVNMKRFSVEDAEGNKIDRAYYTFTYSVSENDAHFNGDSTQLILDSLVTTLDIVLNSADIELATTPAQFVINAAPITASRIEFPEKDFFVGEGFAVADLKVYDVNNVDVTVYAKNEFTKFEFTPKANARMNEAQDSIYFEKAGKVAIKATVGIELVNKFTTTEKMFADQLLVDSIAFPEGPFTVGDTIMPSQFKVFVGEQDVTAFIEDLKLSTADADGHKYGYGVILDKKGSINLTAEVIGRTQGEYLMVMNPIEVDPIEITSVTLPKANYDVLDSIKVADFTFYNGENEINRYVDPAFDFDATMASWANGKIVLEKSGELTITAIANGNATGSQNVTINIAKYPSAEIVFDGTAFVVSEELTPANFSLKDAQGKAIDVRYNKFVISGIEPAAAGHMNGENLVFDQNENVIVTVEVEGEVEAEPLMQPLYIKRCPIGEIVYPKYQYLVGDTIKIADLKVKSKDGRDITSYAEGAFLNFVSVPEDATVVDMAQGIITLEKPGEIALTASMGNDSLVAGNFTNSVFADHLVADRIEFPEGPFTVGDKVLVADFKVFAGERDITKYSDVTLRVDERDAHYVEEGIVLDKKDVVRVYAEVKGFNGVKNISDFKDYNVAPIAADDVNLPATANVMDIIKIENLVISSEGKNINKYADNVEYTFDPANIAHIENNTIFFDEEGTVQVNVKVTGNAEGEFSKSIEVSKYDNVLIDFAGGVYYVADEVKLADFKVVDQKTGKEFVMGDYELVISADAAKSTKVGDNIVLDKAGEITINASLVANNKIAVEDAQFNITVLRANLRTVVYPAAPYVVGNSINVADFIFIDTLGRDITKYADGAIMSMYFNPAENISFNQAEGTVTFLKAGMTNVLTAVGNAEIAPKSLNAYWAVEQQVATSATFQDGPYFVGDTLLLSEVKIMMGEEDITENADPFFIIADMNMGHFLENGDLVFDKANANYDFSIAIKGYESVGKVAFPQQINVQPREAAEVILPAYEYNVFDAMNLNEVIVKDAEGNDITKYAELTYDFDQTMAKMEGHNLVFIKSGDLTLNVKVGGNAAGEFNPVITINKYSNVAINFAGGVYYVADEVKLADFKLIDQATGKEIIADYALTISADAAKGTKVGDNIVLDKAGETVITASLNENDQLAIADAQFNITVMRANATSILYGKQGNYTVGDVLNIADFAVLDSINRDITKYADGAFMNFTFDPVNAVYDKNDGTITFTEAGKTLVTAYLGNSEIAPSTIYKMWAVEQQVATSATFQDGPYFVGDTLLLSEVKIMMGEEDITENADPFFIIADMNMGHFLENGDLVFDKANGAYNFSIAIKGYDNVAKVSFPQQINVQPREAAEVILPAYEYEVLGALNTNEVIVKDAQGNDITKYAELSFSFDETKAQWEGDNIVFYKSGDLTINVKVAGNAVGEFNPVVAVKKNSVAELKVPADNWTCGDKIYLDQFSVVVDGEPFAGEYSLSFDIDAAFGRKLDDNTIVFDKAGATPIVINVTGECALTQEIYTAHVNQCVADRVVFPSNDYIVGDSIAIADLIILDAKNNDITMYVEYKSFEFDPQENAYAKIVDGTEGYIYFTAPGTTKVITTVGGDNMADGKLSNKISIDQAAAALVTLPSQNYTVGDTLNILDVKVYDANGYDITKYCDLMFDFDDEAHFINAAETKIILDKAGDNTIDVVVDGRQGVETVILTPAMTVAPIEVASVVINGTYKVTDLINAEAVSFFAADGRDITQYVGFKALDFEAGVAHAVEGDNFMLDKSGDHMVTVIIGGDNVVATSKQGALSVAKIVAAQVIFPETENNEYRVGDVINKADFIVLDENGNDITKYAVINFTFNPATSAKVNGQGNIEVKETGSWTLNVVLSGDVADDIFPETYFVRHNIIDQPVYDLLVRVWSDMLAVDNTESKFVSYVWFRDEVVIAGQTVQNYYATEADYDGEPHVYYVIAYDANGNEYLIQEKTFSFEMDKASAKKNASIKSATYLNVNEAYTIEASHNGEIYVSNANGLAMDHFQVEEGQNSAIAPAAVGVYVLHFTTEDGQVATEKVIVK